MLRPFLTRVPLSRSAANTLSVGAHGAVGGRLAQGGGGGAAPALETARRQGEAREGRAQEEVGGAAGLFIECDFYRMCSV